MLRYVYDSRFVYSKGGTVFRTRLFITTTFKGNQLKWHVFTKVFLNDFSDGLTSTLYDKLEKHTSENPVNHVCTH